MTRLPTYTSVFRLQRRLYAIYDWELPVPVGLLEVGVFVLAVGLFSGIAAITGIAFTARSAWFFLVPPAFMAYWVRRPLADNKPPHAWLAAQVRYLLEPRRLTDLAEVPVRLPIPARRKRQA